MPERGGEDRARRGPQPANDARDTGESEDPLPPEGLQLLRLIHQDFSLLRACARDLVAPFGEYDDYELLRPPPDEPITWGYFDGEIGKLFEAIQGQIAGFNEVVTRVEAEVTRLAAAYAHAAGPERVREQGYVRIMADGREDWEGPLLAERADPYGGKYWAERIAPRDDPDSVRVGGVQHLLLGEHDPPPGTPGDGGGDYYIRFDDGRFVHAKNVELIGPIPREHRFTLRDNADFLDRASWDALRVGGERQATESREHAASAGPAHPRPSEIARACSHHPAGGEETEPAGPSRGGDYGDSHSA
ncbi:hypothetical protein [Singulisphaera sp. PoT]|uniref:hypothetical protein n=1 Tax=Singulisphaera sp. PoT TaxID=3411797 RepID=UPI003BF50907